jgi:hypothetical protein
MLPRYHDKASAKPRWTMTDEILKKYLVAMFVIIRWMSAVDDAIRADVFVTKA